MFGTALFPSMANNDSAIKSLLISLKDKNIEKPSGQAFLRVACIHREVGVKKKISKKKGCQRYGISRRMLIRSVTPGRNIMVRFPLTWTRSIGYGPEVLTPNLVGLCTFFRTF